MGNFSTMEAFFLVISNVILFIYGLQHFAQELKSWGAEKLSIFFTRWTRTRFGGYLVGAMATALIQSSSAVSSIFISLVDTQVISFSQSLSILIGTNVGTVVTAQMVALKLTGVGPFFIVLGFLLGLHRFTKFAGKSVFYFGFILFALDLISTSLGQLSSDFDLRDYLLYGRSIPMGLFYGTLFTILVQSSSVTSGLIILFLQQDLISTSMAVPMILGANIGTTSTGLIVSLRMNLAAKKSAVANFLLNFIGVLLALPFLGLVLNQGKLFESEKVFFVAQVHLWFNLLNGLIFLAFLRPFERLIEILFKHRTR
jgi:phosphate:Na+ symporter